MYLSTLNQQIQSSNRSDCTTLFFPVNRDYCAIENDNFMSQGFEDWQVGLLILTGVEWFGWCWDTAAEHFEEPGVGFAECFLNWVNRFT